MEGELGPQFLANVRCGQTAGWTQMPIGTEIGLGPGDFVLDGNPAPPPQKGGGAPKFSTNVCGQTAGWIKMVLGTDVGLRPGDFVLDGDSAPSQKRGRSPSPQFSALVYCGQTAAWIKMPLSTFRIVPKQNNGDVQIKTIYTKDQQ